MSYLDDMQGPFQKPQEELPYDNPLTQQQQGFLASLNSMPTQEQYNRMHQDYVDQSQQMAMAGGEEAYRSGMRAAQDSLGGTAQPQEEPDGLLDWAGRAAVAGGKNFAMQGAGIFSGLANFAGTVTNTDFGVAKGIDQFAQENFAPKRQWTWEEIKSNPEAYATSPEGLAADAIGMGGSMLAMNGVAAALTKMIPLAFANQVAAKGFMTGMSGAKAGGAMAKMCEKMNKVPVIGKYMDDLAKFYRDTEAGNIMALGQFSNAIEAMSEGGSAAQEYADEHKDSTYADRMKVALGDAGLNLTYLVGTDLIGDAGFAKFLKKAGGEEAIKEGFLKSVLKNSPKALGAYAGGVVKDAYDEGAQSSFAEYAKGEKENLLDAFNPFEWSDEAKVEAVAGGAGALVFGGHRAAYAMRHGTPAEELNRVADEKTGEISVLDDNGNPVTTEKASSKDDDVKETASSFNKENYEKVIDDQIRRGEGDSVRDNLKRLAGMIVKDIPEREKYINIADYGSDEEVIKASSALQEKRFKADKVLSDAEKSANEHPDPGYQPDYSGVEYEDLEGTEQSAPQTPKPTQGGIQQPKVGGDLTKGKTVQINTGDGNKQGITFVKSKDANGNDVIKAYTNSYESPSFGVQDVLEEYCGFSPSRSEMVGNQKKWVFEAPDDSVTRAKLEKYTGEKFLEDGDNNGVADAEEEHRRTKIGNLFGVKPINVSYTTVNKNGKPQKAVVVTPRSGAFTSAVQKELANAGFKKDPNNQKSWVANIEENQNAMQFLANNAGIGLTDSEYEAVKQDKRNKMFDETQDNEPADSKTKGEKKESTTKKSGDSSEKPKQQGKQSEPAKGKENKDDSEQESEKEVEQEEQSSDNFTKVSSDIATNKQKELLEQEIPKDIAKKYNLPSGKLIDIMNERCEEVMLDNKDNILNGEDGYDDHEYVFENPKTNAVFNACADLDDLNEGADLSVFFAEKFTKKFFNDNKKFSSNATGKPKQNAKANAKSEKTEATKPKTETDKQEKPSNSKETNTEDKDGTESNEEKETSDNKTKKPKKKASESEQEQKFTLKEEDVNKTFNELLNGDLTGRYKDAIEALKKKVLEALAKDSSRHSIAHNIISYLSDKDSGQARFLECYQASSMNPDNEDCFVYKANKTSKWWNRSRVFIDAVTQTKRVDKGARWYEADTKQPAKPYIVAYLNGQDDVSFDGDKKRDGVSDAPIKKEEAASKDNSKDVIDIAENVEDKKESKLIKEQLESDLTKDEKETLKEQFGNDFDDCKTVAEAVSRALDLSINDASDVNELDAEYISASEWVGGVQNILMDRDEQNIEAFEEKPLLTEFIDKAANNYVEKHRQDIGGGNKAGAGKTKRGTINALKPKVAAMFFEGEDDAGGSLRGRGLAGKFLEWLAETNAGTFNEDISDEALNRGFKIWKAKELDKVLSKTALQKRQHEYLKKYTVVNKFTDAVRFIEYASLHGFEIPSIDKYEACLDIKTKAHAELRFEMEELGPKLQELAKQYQQESKVLAEYKKKLEEEALEKSETNKKLQEVSNELKEARKESDVARGKWLSAKRLLSMFEEQKLAKGKLNEKIKNEIKNIVSAFNKFKTKISGSKSSAVMFINNVWDKYYNDNYPASVNARAKLKEYATTEGNVIYEAISKVADKFMADKYKKGYIEDIIANANLKIAKYSSLASEEKNEAKKKEYANIIRSAQQEIDRINLIKDAVEYASNGNIEAEIESIEKSIASILKNTGGDRTVTDAMSEQDSKKIKSLMKKIDEVIAEKGKIDEQLRVAQNLLDSAKHLREQQEEEYEANKFLATSYLFKPAYLKSEAVSKISAELMALKTQKALYKSKRISSDGKTVDNGLKDLISAINKDIEAKEKELRDAKQKGEFEYGYKQVSKDEALKIFSSDLEELRAKEKKYSEDFKTLNNEMKTVDEIISSMGKNVSKGTLEYYNQLKEEMTELESERNTLAQARSDKEKEIKKLKERFDSAALSVEKYEHPEKHGNDKTRKQLDESAQALIRKREKELKNIKAAHKKASEKYDKEMADLNNQVKTIGLKYNSQKIEKLVNYESELKRLKAILSSDYYKERKEKFDSEVEKLLRTYTDKNCDYADAIKRARRLYGKEMYYLATSPEQIKQYVEEGRQKDIDDLKGLVDIAGQTISGHRKFWNAFTALSQAKNNKELTDALEFMKLAAEVLRKDKKDLLAYKGIGFKGFTGQHRNKALTIVPELLKVVDETIAKAEALEKQAKKEADAFDAEKFQREVIDKQREEIEKLETDYKNVLWASKVDTSKLNKSKEELEEKLREEVSGIREKVNKDVEEKIGKDEDAFWKEAHNKVGGQLERKYKPIKKEQNQNEEADKERKKELKEEEKELSKMLDEVFDSEEDDTYTGEEASAEEQSEQADPDNIVPPNVSEETPTFNNNEDFMNYLDEQLNNNDDEEVAPESHTEKNTPISEWSVKDIKEFFEKAYGVSLEPHQIRTIHKAYKALFGNNQKGFLIGDGMGTGKTVDALSLAILAGRANGKTIPKILVIAPNTASINEAWTKDPARFKAPGQKDGALAINVLSSSGSAVDGKVNIITKDALLKNKNLAQDSFDMVIFDEGQNLGYGEDVSETNPTEVLKCLRNIGGHKSGMLSGYVYTVLNPLFTLWNKARIAAEKSIAQKAKPSESLESVMKRFPSVAGDVKTEIENWKILHEEIKKHKQITDKLTKERERTKVVFLSGTPFSYLNNAHVYEGFVFNYDDNNADSFYIDRLGMKSVAKKKLKNGKFKTYNEYVDPSDTQRLRGAASALHSVVMNNGTMTNEVKPSSSTSADSHTSVAVCNESTFAALEHFVNTFLRANDPCADMQQFRERYNKSEKFAKFRGQAEFSANFKKIIGVNGNTVSPALRSVLGEVLRANSAITLIRDNIAAGRKTVLFHEFVKGNNKAKNYLKLSDSIRSKLEEAGLSEELALYDSIYGDAIKAIDDILKKGSTPIEILRKEFKSKAVFVNGETTDALDDVSIKSFNEPNDKVMLFVGNIQKCASSLNLQDRKTDKVHFPRTQIHIETPTMSSLFLQSRDRTLRLDTATDCGCVYLIGGTNEDIYNYCSPDKISGKIDVANITLYGDKANALGEMISRLALLSVKDGGNPSRAELLSNFTGDRSIINSITLGGSSDAETISKIVETNVLAVKSKGVANAQKIAKDNGYSLSVDYKLSTDKIRKETETVAKEKLGELFLMLKRQYRGCSVTFDENKFEFTITKPNGHKNILSMQEELVISESEMDLAKKNENLSDFDNSDIVVEGKTVKVNADNIDSIIYLRKDASISTAAHEIMHDAIDYLTEEERNVLRKGYDASSGKSFEEYVCDKYADYIAGKTQSEQETSIMSKIKRFLLNLKNIFRKVSEYNDVFDKVFSGEVQERSISDIVNTKINPDVADATGTVCIKTNSSLDSAGKNNELKEKVNDTILTTKTESGISVQDKNTSGDAGFFDKFFVSPSKLAQKYSWFRPLFHSMAKAVKEQERLRGLFRAEYQEAVSHLKTKEDATDVSQILFEEDATHTVYSSEELKAQGYNNDVIRCHNLIRKLLNKLWDMNNDVFREMKKYSDVVSADSLNMLKSNKFVSDLKVFNGSEYVPLSNVNIQDGKLYQVTYNKPKTYIAHDGLTQEQLDELKKSDNARIISYKQDKNKKGEFKVEYETAVPNIGRIIGYVPHMYGNFVVVMKRSKEEIINDKFNKDEEVIISSARTKAEAIEIAEQLVKDSKDINADSLIVRPNSFSSESLANGSFAYSSPKVTEAQKKSIIYSIAKELDIPVSKAKEVMSKKLSKVSRNRAFANLKNRDGQVGFSRNLFTSLDMYTMASARYIAMQPAKRRCIDSYEATFKQRYDEIPNSTNASIARNYISRCNGDKGDLENAVENMIDSIPWLGKWLRDNYGGSIAKRGAGSINSFIAKTTLGAWNISSALVSLSQLSLVYSKLGSDYTAKGIVKARKPTAKEKKIFEEIGIEYELGMYATDEFAKKLDNIKLAEKSGNGIAAFAHTLNRYGDKGMQWFQDFDLYCRKVAVLGAYYRAVDKGLDHAAAIKEADKLNREANFSYGIEDAPGLFRDLSGTGFGDLALLFQKYPIKATEFVVDTLLNGTTQEKVRTIATFIALSGMMSIPGLDWLDSIWEQIFGHRIVSRAKAYVIEKLGDNAITRTALYGALANKPFAGGVDISRRVGLSGVIPEKDNMIGYASGVAGSKLYDFANNMVSKEYIKAVKTVVPTVGYLLESARGYSTNSKGAINHVYTPTERVLKGMGFRTIGEAMEADINSAMYDESKMSKEEKSSFKTQMAKKQINGEKLSIEEVKRLKELGITSKQLAQARKDLKLQARERIRKGMGKDIQKKHQALLDEIDED